MGTTVYQPAYFVFSMVTGRGHREHRSGYGYPGSHSDLGHPSGGAGDRGWYNLRYTPAGDHVLLRLSVSDC